MNITQQEYIELLNILLKHSGGYERRTYTDDCDRLRMPLPSKV